MPVWIRRRPGGLVIFSRRADGCVVAMCRPSPVSWRDAKFICRNPKTGWLRSRPEFKVRCWCYWQPSGRQNALTVIVVHGLEGSSDSQYMLGIARNGLAAGMNVVLMNQRNCGGMDHCRSDALQLKFVRRRGGGRSDAVNAMASRDSP